MRELSLMISILRLDPGGVFTGTTRVLSHSVLSDSSQPFKRQPARVLCPWDFSGKILEWVAFPSPGDLCDPGIKPDSPVCSALQVNFLPTEPLRKPLYRYISLEKEMATHASILAWRIPWTEEPGGL